MGQLLALVSRLGLVKEILIPLIKWMGKRLKKFWKWSLKKLDKSPIARVAFLSYVFGITGAAFAFFILWYFFPQSVPGAAQPITMVGPNGSTKAPPQLIVRGNAVSYGDWHDRIPLGGRLIIDQGKAPRVQKYRLCFVPKAGAAYSRGEFRPVGGARLVCLDRFGVEALVGEDSLYGGLDCEWPVLNTVTSSVGYALPYQAPTDPVSPFDRLYFSTNVALRY